MADAAAPPPAEAGLLQRMWQRWKALRLRLKEHFAEYGSIAIVVYLSLFVLTWVGFTIAIKAGVGVEGAAGETGSIGAAYVSKAPADGYTLCLLSSSFTTNAAIQPNLPFDPVNAFTAVGMVAKGPMLLTVGNHVPVRTTLELFDLAQSAEKRLDAACRDIVVVLELALFEDAAEAVS